MKTYINIRGEGHMLSNQIHIGSALEKLSKPVIFNQSIMDQVGNQRCVICGKFEPCHKVIINGLGEKNIGNNYHCRNSAWRLAIYRKVSRGTLVHKSNYNNIIKLEKERINK